MMREEREEDRERMEGGREIGMRESRRERVIRDEGEEGEREGRKEGGREGRREGGNERRCEGQRHLPVNNSKSRLHFIHSARAQAIKYTSFLEFTTISQCI